MPGTARGRDPVVEEEFLGALYRGGQLLAEGKIVEAREHLERAHELSPKNEKAQNLLGLAYFKLGLFDQASHVYELLVRENPADPTLRVNLGLVYLKTNNLERAVREFETATDLEPGHKKAHNYLGLALAQQGDYGKARDHFVAAGSEQMAEKMDKALSTRASSHSSSVAMTVPSAPAATARAVTGAPAQALPVTAPAPMPLLTPKAAPPPTPSPLAPPAAQEEAIEVMSDDELPPEEGAADVEVDAPPLRAAQPSLSSDWGAQLPVPPPAPEEELRFAEDEGPAALLNDAPLVPIESQAEPLHVPLEPIPTGDGAADMPMLESEAVQLEVEVQAPVHEAPPAWLTTEANEANEATQAAERAEPPSDVTQMWVTETVAEVPLTSPTPAPEPRPSAGLPVAPSEETWASASTEAFTAPSTDGWQPPALERVVTEPAPPVEDWSTPAAGGYEAAGSETDFSSAGDAQDGQWVAQPLAEASVPGAYAAEVQGAPYQQAFEDPSQVTEAAIEQYAEASAGSWEHPVEEQVQQEGERYHDAAPAGDPLYEPAAEVPVAEAPIPLDHPVDAQPFEAAQPLEPAQPLEDTPPSEDPYPFDETQHPEAAQQFEGAPPEASAPWEPPAAEPMEPAAHAPEGAFAPMDSQRLEELGAAAGWAQEPSASPFQLGTQGLAVTVAGEMLVRMTGLVAVVGGVKVAPEMRRKRGRPTQEPFGVGPAQLQRVTGNGVLYLEAGKTRFHSVDLTDQPGTAVDDEGAYLREELLFAFEEVVSFENGRLAGEGGSLAVDLVHLKGRGRVLLQLEGTLKAMAIPPGAPMVVPLHRLVGWFGRVSPRLMGFGGQGAVELTGDGFALLGTPSST